MTNDVFFLGAGFSKAIDEHFPLMSDLTKEIIGEQYSKLPDYGRKEFLPESCKNNFESLLTYLATDLPWKTENERCLDNILYIHIAKQIKDFFSNGSLYHNTTQNLTYKPLWQYIMNNNSPVITLNYDLIVEKNLILCEKDNPRVALYTKSGEHYEPYYRGKIVDIANTVKDLMSMTNAMPEILKLHGSANWYYNGDDTHSQIYCSDNETEIEQRLVEVYKPFIVPPVLDKTKFYKNNTIQLLWNSAFKYIAKAQKIYIIGFSFPTTDLSVKYLFESAMKLNSCSPVVYVINTDTTDNLKQRYINIFGENKCNFDFCKPNAMQEFMQKELMSRVNIDEKGEIINV